MRLAPRLLLVVAILAATATAANAQYGFGMMGYNPYSMQTAAQRQAIHYGGYYAPSYYGYGYGYGGYGGFYGDSWTPGSTAYELRLLRQHVEVNHGFGH